MSETAGKDSPMAKSKQTIPVVGGVDTHKDLHVAAVVDNYDQVMGTHSFATTRQGYKLMLASMRSLGGLQRIGVECTAAMVPAFEIYAGRWCRRFGGDCTG